MTERQQNVKWQVLDALKNFASAEKQMKYKDKVPFVHIPFELMAQWNYFRDNRNQDWYQQIWTPAELKSLDEFSAALKNLLPQLGKQPDDVPEILDNAIWKEIMEKAREALDAFPVK
jgi:hypothetical protein